MTVIRSFFKVHTYILSYLAAFFTTLLVEQIEQITYAYTHIRKEYKTSTSSLHSLYALHFTVTYIFDSVCDA